MIESIYIASESGAALSAVKTVQLLAGQGIVGDRNFGASQWPGQNLTLIAREQIAIINQHLAKRGGPAFNPEDLRRNIVTSGIDLNALEGQHFRIGQVELFGVELCEPCAHLSEQLAEQLVNNHSSLSKADIVKLLTHRGDLRCDIITGGPLSIGTTFDLT